MLRMNNMPFTSVQRQLMSMGTRLDPGVTGGQTELGVDPFRVVGMSGKPAFIDSRQRAYNVAQVFLNRAGFIEPLTESAMQNRNIIVDGEVDSSGAYKTTPVFRELKDGEALGTRELLSAWGLQERSTNGFVEAGYAFMNSLSSSLYEIGAIASRKRFEMMKDWYEGNWSWTNLAANPMMAISNMAQKALTPNKASWDEVVRAGNLPWYAMMNPDVNKLYNRMDKFLPMLDEVEKNIVNIRKQAGKGDMDAMRKMDAYDFFRGEHADGDNYLERLSNVYDATAAKMQYKPSELAEQGAFHSWSGFGNAMGDLFGQLVPQVIVSYLTAGMLTSATMGAALMRSPALRGLLSTAQAGKKGTYVLSNGSIVRNLLRGQAPKIGGQTVARAVGTGVPALQVASDSYMHALQSGFTPEEALEFGEWMGAAMVSAEMVVGTPYMLNRWMDYGGSKGMMKLFSRSPDGSSSRATPRPLP